MGKTRLRVGAPHRRTAERFSRRRRSGACEALWTLALAFCCVFVAVQGLSVPPALRALRGGAGGPGATGATSGGQPRAGGAGGLTEQRTNTHGPEAPG